MYASDYTSSSGGSSKLKIQKLTASGDILGFNYMVECDATSGILTATLPPSTAETVGQSIIIKKMDNSNNPIAIKANGTETIDGSTNLIYLYNQNDSVMIISNESGKSLIGSDNRNSTGNSANYLYAERLTSQTIVDENPIIFTNTTKQIGSNIAINGTTGVITLKPNSSYSIRSGLGITTGTNTYVDVTLQKSTDGTTWTKIGVSGSLFGTGYSFNYGHESVAHSIIDTTTTTFIRLLVKDVSGTTVVAGDVLGGFPWIEVDEINKQATVMAISDSVFCYKTTTQSSAVVGATLTWDKMVGNMTSSSPYVTLNAGKTYEIMFAISGTVNTSGGEVYLSLYDSTGTLLPDQVQAHVFTMTSISSDGSSGTGYCKITPTSNLQIQVKINTLFGCTSVNLRSDGTWLKVTQIGSTAVSSVPSNLLDTSSGLDVSGYTQLGSGAPAIKMKILTGTTGAVGGATSPSHGVTFDKIISATCQVKSDTGFWMYPEWSSDAGYKFNFYVKSTTVDIILGASASHLTTKAYVVTIFYTE